MKKKIFLILIVSSFCSELIAQNQSNEKPEVKKFFELKFKTNSSEANFIDLAKKTEGIEDIISINYTSDLALVNVFTKDGIKATPDFIEDFCIKIGLKQVFIDEKIISVDLISESIKKAFKKNDGRFKEH